MENIAENLGKTRDRIHFLEQKYGRAKGSVKLLAVSKTHPAGRILEAVRAGQMEFGENYVQEAVAKIGELRDPHLVWHFIGPVQSNKTRLLAMNVAWVHGINNLKIAHRLGEARPADRPPLNVCIQVNISAEMSKSGVDPEQLAELVRQVAAVPRLHLRGLMVIPAPEQDFERQRLPFRRTRELLEQLNAAGMQLDTLSMGMSEDMEAAIAEGATIVRIGTAIFGARQT